MILVAVAGEVRYTTARRSMVKFTSRLLEERDGDGNGLRHHELTKNRVVSGVMQIFTLVSEIEKNSSMRGAKHDTGRIQSSKLEVPRRVLIALQDPKAGIAKTGHGA